MVKTDPSPCILHAAADCSALGVYAFHGIEPRLWWRTSSRGHLHQPPRQVSLHRASGGAGGLEAAPTTPPPEKPVTNKKRVRISGRHVIEFFK